MDEDENEIEVQHDGQNSSAFLGGEIFCPLVSVPCLTGPTPETCLPRRSL